MSDLNDLIHTNAVIAFQQGEQRERERIIKLLREKNALRDSFFLDGLVLYTEDGPIDITSAEIKGEQK